MKSAKCKVKSVRHGPVLQFVLCILHFSLCTLAAFSAPPEPKFEAQTIDDKISIGYGVATGDVDGDGKPDILLADAKQIVWYKNPGEPGKAWSKFVIAENLTPLDNVCIAARDINGDGKVEVAVGAQWNPGETTDPEKSGAIFYLIRPEDPTQKWEPVQIKPHEPTVHRMAWVRINKGDYRLAVLPLHGRGNVKGEGESVQLFFYDLPSDVRRGPVKTAVVNTQMHLTHNFDVVDYPSIKDTSEYVWVGGREGLQSYVLAINHPAWLAVSPQAPLDFGAIGEVRLFGGFAAAIQPLHGNQVVFFKERNKQSTIILDASLKEGHALVVADLLSLNLDQIIAGWRMPNAEKKVGIRMYVPQDEKYETWKTYTIDDNNMACEDLKVADLDGDGRPDIVASGRATKNVIVYWNRTETK